MLDLGLKIFHPTLASMLQYADSLALSQSVSLFKSCTQQSDDYEKHHVGVVIMPQVIIVLAV